jgi:hypothetical protein
MLVLGFQLVVGVTASDVFPKFGCYADVVLVIREIIQNSLLRYLEVGVQGLFGFLISRCFRFALEFFGFVGLLP